MKNKTKNKAFDTNFQWYGTRTDNRNITGTKVKTRFKSGFFSVKEHPEGKSLHARLAASTLK